MKVVQRRAAFPAPARDPAGLEQSAVSDGGGAESLYEAYVRKRDAKLREEWGAKEAKMRALRERLEERSAEMKATLSWSGRRGGGGGGKALLARRSADISRASGSSREIHKEDEQVYDGGIDNVQDGFTGELDGRDSTKFADFDNKSSDRSSLPLAHPKSSTSIDEPHSSDSSKASIPSKSISGRSFSSQLHVNSIALPPRPSKHANGTGKSRFRQEKLTGHMTPSTPDLKVKNVKPSVERSRTRVHAYGRSTQEESDVFMEEKPRSSRSNSVNPVESRSGLARRDINSSPVRFDHKQVQRGVKPKSFLRKGKGTGQVAAGNGAAERKNVPSSSEEQVPESLMDQVSDRVSIAQEDDDIGDSSMEELDGPSGMAQEFSAEEEILKTDNDISEFSIGSVCSVYPYMDTEEALVSNVQMQIDASSAVDGNTRTLEDFAEEVSSLHDTDAHNPPSYAQEASEFDVSEDNYMGSTQVWHDIPSDHTREDDSAQMNANRTMHAANSQPQVAKKNMRKRLMRLLNFGRKRRGSETSENDWVSTPKLEGVRDNEDCQEPAIRGSDIAKSSRKGFSDRYSTGDGKIVRSSSLDQGQTSQNSVSSSGSLKAMDDSISGSLLKVPRSFLSLANLRSKAGESRQR